MEKTAVIILNWNGERLLREYLPEVLRNTPENHARVIVADNGSTDGSRELLRRDFPQVEVWEFPENYGFAEGYNVAIARASEYPTVVLLNSDVAPDPGWIEALQEYMDAHPEVAACQPKLLSYTDPSRFEYAGAAGGFIDRNGYPYCRGRIFDTCETDSGQYDTPLKVDWATGACLFVRRELYLRVGGLDKAFFAHMEEIDLCWRLRLAGFDIAAVPAATVRHLGGGSLPPRNPPQPQLPSRRSGSARHLLVAHDRRRFVPAAEDPATKLYASKKMVLQDTDGIGSGLCFGTESLDMDRLFWPRSRSVDPQLGPDTRL